MVQGARSRLSKRISSLSGLCRRGLSMPASARVDSRLGGSERDPPIWGPPTRTVPVATASPCACISSPIGANAEHHYGGANHRFQRPQRHEDICRNMKILCIADAAPINTPAIKNGVVIVGPIWHG
jgi:hypothetical protein